jgi:hypothetical protein
MKLYSKSIAAAIAIAALSTPSALAGNALQYLASPDRQGTAQAPTALQYLPSPDTREAASAPNALQYLPSPDTREVSSAPTALQYLRSADPRDAASAPTPIVTIVARGGFDWSDAAIGAVSAFGLTLLVGATLVVLRRRVQAGSGSAAATSLP